MDCNRYSLPGLSDTEMKPHGESLNVCAGAPHYDVRASVEGCWRECEALVRGLWRMRDWWNAEKHAWQGPRPQVRHQSANGCHARDAPELHLHFRLRRNSTVFFPDIGLRLERPQRSVREDDDVLHMLKRV